MKLKILVFLIISNSFYFNCAIASEVIFDPTESDNIENHILPIKLNLSAIYSDGLEYYCIINEITYQEHDIIEDYRIFSINSEKVSLENINTNAIITLALD